MKTQEPDARFQDLEQPSDAVRECEPLLRTIKITICQACLDGEGEECHTPGCALWMHRVDLPIGPGMYEVLWEEEPRTSDPAAPADASGRGS